MGKSIRRKTAKFELEPDGFSIHTFELSRQIKGKHYHEIRDYLYSLHGANGDVVTFNENKQVVKCIAFSDYGLNISLVKNDSDYGYASTSIASTMEASTTDWRSSRTPCRWTIT